MLALSHKLLFFTSLFVLLCSNSLPARVATEPSAHQVDRPILSEKEDNESEEKKPDIVLPGFMHFIINQLQPIQQEEDDESDPVKEDVDTVSENKKTFADVRGQDSVLTEVREIVDFLKNPQKYAAFGAKIPKGVLLQGAPGTGKTLIARAIAGEANCRFFYTSASAFVDRFVGMGAHNIRELFNKARKAQPAILFIDEIDAIGAVSRGSPTGSEEYRQTLNELLNQLDGFRKDENIVVIAATNLVSALDPALVRPGRFTRVIEVPLPTKKGRVDILNYYLEKITRLAPDVSAEWLSEQTGGFSGADLENLVNEAAILAVREDALQVIKKHFEDAWDKVILGLEGNFERTHEQRLKTAYHESGHALVQYLHKMPLSKVTILPRGGTLGVTKSLQKHEFASDYSRQDWLNKIMSAQGGFIAEKIVYGHADPGVCSDLQHANAIANRMVNEWGMAQGLEGIAGDGFNSEKMRAFCDEQMKNILQECLTATENLLQQHRDKLEKLTQELMKKETLSGEDVQRLFS